MGVPGGRTRLTVLVGGIEEDVATQEAWLGRLQAYLEPRLTTETAFLRYTHPYIAAVGFGLPLIGSLIRKYHLARFRAAVAAATAHEGPGAEVDLIGHSFGTWLAWHSVLDEGRGPRLFYRRMVFMGSIVSSGDDLRDQGRHFEAILNCWSDHDEVVRFAPFGHAGYRGFEWADGRSLVNLNCSPCPHRGYTQPCRAWDGAADFLNKSSGAAASPSV